MSLSRVLMLSMKHFLVEPFRTFTNTYQNKSIVCLKVLSEKIARAWILQNPVRVIDFLKDKLGQKAKSQA